MYQYTIDSTDGHAPEILQTLDELAREGARRMIAAALEAEVEEYLAQLRGERDERGVCFGGAQRQGTGAQSDPGRRHGHHSRASGA